MSFSAKLVSLISDNNKFICLTGAGGKTSLMQLLAEEYKKLGNSVLMTTTTKIQSPLHYKWQADLVLTSKKTILDFEITKPCVVCYAEPNENPEKLQSPDLETLKLLKDKFDVVICEADGNRQNPIKIHTEKDPVVPDFATYTICMMGAWGQVDNLQEYIDNPQGLFKGSIPNNRIAVINGCECITNSNAISFLNIQWPIDCAILLASVKQNELFRNC